MRALANSVGGDVSKLNTRAVLADGKLRSAEAPSVAPPVWFVFTGALAICTCLHGPYAAWIETQLPQSSACVPGVKLYCSTLMFPTYLVKILPPF